MNDAATAYERAQTRGREELRATLLDAASRLLAAEGPGGLTMRRVATEVGASTTVLYTMFGGKDGLAEALFLEGFDRFRRRLEAVPHDPDPLAYLYGLARAYRANALAERNYYGVMFGQAIPGYVPSPQARDNAKASFAILVNAVRDCVEAGVFTAGDSEEIAEVLWATAHGAVSLELAGYLGGETTERRYETALGAAASYFLAAD